MTRSEHVIHFPVPPRRIVLAGAAAPGRTYTEQEFEAGCREARQRGAAEATEFIERQMLELRSEAVHLQSRTFTELAAAHANVIAQFRTLLAELATAAAARVLASTPVSRDTVLAIVGEMLGNVESGSPELEVRLASGDLELIAGLEADFRQKHPAIIFQADAELKPGDCIVQSRFGMLDGTVATKLQICKEALHAA